MLRRFHSVGLPQVAQLAVDPADRVRQPRQEVAVAALLGQPEGVVQGGQGVLVAAAVAQGHAQREAGAARQERVVERAAEPQRPFDGRQRPLVVALELAQQAEPAKRIEPRPGHHGVFACVLTALCRRLLPGQGQDRPAVPLRVRRSAPGPWPRRRP